MQKRVCVRRLQGREIPNKKIHIKPKKEKKTKQKNKQKKTKQKQACFELLHDIKKVTNIPMQKRGCVRCLHGREVPTESPRWQSQRSRALAPLQQQQVAQSSEAKKCL